MVKRRVGHGLFKRIRSWQEAVDVTVDCAAAFWIYAFVLALAGIFLHVLLLLDAGVYGVLGFFLLAYSRVAALAAVVVAFGSLAVTLWNKYGGGDGFGTNLFMAVLLCGVALRSVQATFKVHRFANGHEANAPASEEETDTETPEVFTEAGAEAESWRGTPGGRRRRLVVILLVLGAIVGLGLSLMPKPAEQATPTPHQLKG